jgi:hypothetical protein
MQRFLHCIPPRALPPHRRTDVSGAYFTMEGVSALLWLRIKTIALAVLQRIPRVGELHAFTAM